MVSCGRASHTSPLLPIPTRTFSSSGCQDMVLTQAQPPPKFHPHDLEAHCTQIPSLYIKAYSLAFPGCPAPPLLWQKPDHTFLQSPLLTMLCPSGIIIGGAQKVRLPRMGSVLALVFPGGTHSSGTLRVSRALVSSRPRNLELSWVLSGPFTPRVGLRLSGRNQSGPYCTPLSCSPVGPSQRTAASFYSF